MLKVIFFGTPQFSADVLDYLLQQGIDICAVVTRIDTPKKRSKKLLPPPVKILLEEKYPNIPILQPVKTSEPDFQAQLESFQADMFVFVAYGKIVGRKILNMPKLDCINLHTSLLPKFRGAAPIQRSIMEGETETGATVMHMVFEMDAGNIISQEKVLIPPNMTLRELEQALCSKGKVLLKDIIGKFKDPNLPKIVQDESLVTFAPKVELEDSLLDWNKSATKVYDTYRGTTPTPGSWCQANIKGQNKRLKIIRCTKIDLEHNQKPGTILEYDKNGITIACQTNAIIVTELQPEGKRPMLSRDFVNGIQASEIIF